MKKLGIFFFLFSVVLLIILIPKIGENEIAIDILGEDFNTDEVKLLPYLIGAIILIISISIFIQDWITKRKIQDDGLSHINLKKLKDVGILLAISLLYVILLEPIGFFIMTPIWLFICLLFLGSRKWFSLSVIPFLITIFIFLSFEKLMSIQLPKGILEWMFY